MDFTDDKPVLCLGARAWLALVAVPLFSLGCDEKSEKPAEASAAASAVAAPSAPTPKAEPAPAGCQAKGAEPQKLGESSGVPYGLVGDATHLYFATWEPRLARGLLVQVRKDGQGVRNLTSLALQPRDVALDQASVYYTEGIRLKKISKDGEELKTLDEKFSSQSIAVEGKFVFGVPGDYGPFDRFVRQGTEGGPYKELDVSERAEVKDGPAGYSALAVDADGAYVTDAGRGTILRFALDREKPKVLASGFRGAHELVLAGDTLYFTLALKGELFAGPRSGGKPKKIASGLVKEARIAADQDGVVAPFVGATEDAPPTLGRVSPAGGEPSTVAKIPDGYSAEAVALDGNCIYWAQRQAGSGTLEILARAR